MQLVVANAPNVVQQAPEIILNDTQVACINRELAQGRQIHVTSAGVIYVNTSPTTTGGWLCSPTGTSTSTASIWIPNGYTTVTSTTTTTSISTTGIYTSGTAGTYWASSVGVYVPPKPKRGPLIKKSVKSSIKRALSLMANFGMEEDVRIFLGGDDIEVSHPESLFKFVISKGHHKILRATEFPGYSTPYKLALYTKTDVHVADLCVYMEKTPMLDQVLALSMFVRSGNEEQLLEKANFLRLTNDIPLRKQLAVGNPMLAKKLRTDTVVIH
jgi:hypothetical protein